MLYNPLHPSKRRGFSAIVLTLLTAVVLALAALVVPVTASAATGDIGSEGPSHSGTGTPTGTKRSTSNLWFNDGIWWGNLWDTASQDFEIFKFNPSTNQWTSTGVTTDTRASTHHDVLWDKDGNTLYVASYRFVNDGVAAEPNFPTTLHRFSYNSTTDSYTSLGSSQINNYRVEALTIDKEQSSGRLWATWQQGNRIYLNVTGTDGKTWGTPFPHPASLSNVSIDDTSAVIAFGGNKIGVMWSRQVGDATDGMYWSVHVDGASNSSWTTPVAAVHGARSGDDHMNLKWLDATADQVFAAVKTSFTSSSQPLIQLLALNVSTGTWTPHTIATVAECPNRVIVLIDEAAQMLRTFATYPKPGGTTNAGVCTSSGGAIYEKSVPLSDVTSIGSAQKIPRIVDADQYVHNVTSTKQNLNSDKWGTVNSGLLILADVNATSRYWHYYDPKGGGTTTDTTPPTVTNTSPTGTGVAATTNVTGTFSEAMNSSTVNSGTFTLAGPGTTSVTGAVNYDGATRVATLNPNTDLAAGTTYTATIKGGASGVKDVAGNALVADKTWTFTTAAAPPPAGGTTVTLTATADSYVLEGSPSANYGTSSLLSVDASPRSTSYLKFDLTSYGGRIITGATLQLHCSTSGSTGVQSVKLVADDSWTETGIIYSNRPTLGSILGSFGSTSIGTDRSITLTADALKGDLGGQLSLGLDTASSDGLDLGSRETSTPPKLVLTFQ